MRLFPVHFALGNKIAYDERQFAIFSSKLVTWLLYSKFGIGSLSHAELKLNIFKTLKTKAGIEQCLS